MIKEFNVSTSATANLFGEHYADTVYAADVVLHPDDIEYGVLVCNELLVDIMPSDLSDCAPNDRIYKGVLHCRDVVLRQKEVVDEDVQA